MTRRAHERALSAVFAALADETRRKVLRRVGQGPERASDLAEKVGASRPGLSRHLRLLREAGLITERIDEGDGRARLIELAPGAFETVRGFCDEVEEYWSAQLGAFKAYVENEARAPSSASSRRPQRKAVS